MEEYWKALIAGLAWDTNEDCGAVFMGVAMVIIVAMSALLVYVSL